MSKEEIEVFKKLYDEYINQLSYNHWAAQNEEVIEKAKEIINKYYRENNEKR